MGRQRTDFLSFMVNFFFSFVWRREKKNRSKIVLFVIYVYMICRPVIKAGETENTTTHMWQRNSWEINLYQTALSAVGGGVEPQKVHEHVAGFLLAGDVLFVAARLEENVFITKKKKKIDHNVFFFLFCFKIIFKQTLYRILRN